MTHRQVLGERVALGGELVHLGHGVADEYFIHEACQCRLIAKRLLGPSCPSPPPMHSQRVELAGRLARPARRALLLLLLVAPAEEHVHAALRDVYTFAEVNKVWRWMPPPIPAPAQPQSSPAQPSDVMHPSIGCMHDTLAACVCEGATTELDAARSGDGTMKALAASARVAKVRARIMLCLWLAEEEAKARYARACRPFVCVSMDGGPEGWMRLLDETANRFDLLGMVPCLSSV